MAGKLTSEAGRPDPARRRGRATSYDVARLAGVSQSAVSRAFNAGTSVSPDMRQRVLQAARELGYRPSVIPKVLLTRRSNLIGLLLPQDTSLYYPEITVEITAEVAKRGARVLLIAADGEAEVEAALEQLWGYRVDGLIAVSRLTRPQLHEFEIHDIPVIHYNHAPVSHTGSGVMVDHVEGSARLIDRLWGAGLRRFGVIGGGAGAELAQERMQGGLQRLAELQAPTPPVVEGNYQYQSGIEGFAKLWTAHPELEAVLCANDAMGLGAMDCARTRFGLKVPETVSITGFDGFGVGRWLAYDLTTLRQPLHAMAEATAELLFTRIEDPDRGPERRTFSAELVVGRSARLGPELDR